MKTLSLVLSILTLIVGFQNCSKVAFDKDQNDKPNPQCTVEPCSVEPDSLQVIAHKQSNVLNSEELFSYQSDELYITVLNAESGVMGCLDIEDLPQCSSDPTQWEFKWDHFERVGSTLRLRAFYNFRSQQYIYTLTGGSLLDSNRWYIFRFYNPITGEHAHARFKIYNGTFSGSGG